MIIVDGVHVSIEMSPLSDLPPPFPDPNFYKLRAKGFRVTPSDLLKLCLIIIILSVPCSPMFVPWYQWKVSVLVTWYHSVQLMLASGYWHLQCRSLANDSQDMSSGLWLIISKRINSTPSEKIKVWQLGCGETSKSTKWPANWVLPSFSSQKWLATKPTMFWVSLSLRVKYLFRVLLKKRLLWMVYVFQLKWAPHHTSKLV